MGRRSALHLLAVALPTSAALAGCASQTCTEAYCEDAITFTFDERVPRDYVVTVQIGDATGTADCTAAVSSDTNAEVGVNLEGDLSAGVLCGPEQLVVHAAPTSIRVTIAYPDGTTTNADAQPAYEELRPNGEDCGPVCDHAEIAIDVHAPTTGA